MKTPQAILPTPTPEEYVARHRNELEALRDIRRRYEGNVQHSPTCDHRLAYQKLLDRFDAELLAQGIVL